MKIKSNLIISILILLGFTAMFGCSNKDKLTETPNTYISISAEAAKALMESETDYVILDVRTQEEYDEKHITNSVLIPDYEISEKAEEILKDKNQLILVYCRSGRRSKIASAKLVEMGYTNIKEFGGIIDWQFETEY